MLPWRWRRTSWSHQKESSTRYTSNGTTTSGIEREFKLFSTQSHLSCPKHTPWMILQRYVTTLVILHRADSVNSIALKYDSEYWINESIRVNNSPLTRSYASSWIWLPTKTWASARSARAISSRAAEINPHCPHTQRDTERELDGREGLYNSTYTHIHTCHSKDLLHLWKMMHADIYCSYRDQLSKTWTR